MITKARELTYIKGRCDKIPTCDQGTRAIDLDYLNLGICRLKLWRELVYLDGRWEVATRGFRFVRR